MLSFNLMVYTATADNTTTATTGHKTQKNEHDISIYDSQTASSLTCRMQE